MHILETQNQIWWCAVIDNVLIWGRKQTKRLKRLEETKANKCWYSIKIKTTFKEIKLDPLNFLDSFENSFSLRFVQRDDPNFAWIDMIRNKKLNQPNDEANLCNIEITSVTVSRFLSKICADGIKSS